MTLVSGNISFMRILAGVPWRGEASNNSQYRFTDPCNVEMKSVFEVFRLRDYHQVEAPAAAEISDDDGVNWP